MVTPESVAELVTTETTAVVVMAANNETGVIQPIAAIGELCASCGVPFLSDTVQLLGWAPLDVRASNVAAATVSAHKMYGPKGAGALYLRREFHRRGMEPLLEGGGQERGLRSGTQNVPGIVGLGLACELASQRSQAVIEEVRALRDHLLDGLRSSIEGCHVHGSLQFRLPHNLSVSFDGIESGPLLVALHDLAVSSGSACNSGALEPSHVLRSMGVSEDHAWGAIRFGLGLRNTKAEVDFAIQRVAEEVHRLRSL